MKRRETGGFINLGNTGNFWTSTIESGYTWFRLLSYDDKEVPRYGANEKAGFSVRFLRDWGWSSANRSSPC